MNIKLKKIHMPEIKQILFSHVPHLYVSLQFPFLKTSVKEMFMPLNQELMTTNHSNKLKNSPKNAP